MAPLPVAQPWRLGWCERVTGKGAGAALSLPRKMQFRIFPLSLQVEQWKSRAVGWVSPVCSAHPFLVGCLQPVSPCGNGDVGGDELWQGAQPFWRQPCRARKAGPGGAEGDARTVGACSGFPEPCFREGEVAVTLVMVWGKMQPRGCWSGLPSQPVPVGFKLN